MVWAVVLVPALGGAALWWRGARASWSSLALAVGGGATLLATTAIAVTAVLGGDRARYEWGSGLAITLATGRAASVMAVLVPGIAGGVAVYAAFHERRVGRARLIGGLVAFVGAMELLVLAGDVLTLLTAWELVGACSWALIAHEWRDASNVQAAGHAFLATRIGDLGLFVAAGAALVGGDRSLGYAGLAQLHGAPLHVFVGGIVLAAAAKSAQLPFSPWLFSAMAGPTSASALLHAATMVAAGAFILIRLHPVLDLAGWFAPVTIGLGLATALVGGVVAIAQTHGKKLLAASTSAHYGLMFVAAGAGYPAAALAHLVAHAVVKAGLFMSAGVAGNAVGTYELGRQRLGRAMPTVAAATLVLSLALAGIPPLGAAWTKEGVIAAAGHRGGWLALLTALAGALSAVYALRFQVLAFGRTGRRERPPEQEPSRAETTSIVVPAVMCITLGVLWLPGSDAVVRRLSGARFPDGSSWELLVSLALIGSAAWAVVAADRCGSLLGRRDGQPRWPLAAGWAAIPRLVEVGVVRPTLRSATWLGEHAEGWFDAPARAVAAPHRAARRSERALDAVPAGAEVAVPRTAAALAAADRQVVDAGIRAAFRVTEWLATVGSRVSERRVDEAVRSVAAAIGTAGRRVRRLQTGMAHQYYVVIATVTLAVVVTLVVWR